jgi:hypothetical protein
MMDLLPKIKPVDVQPAISLMDGNSCLKQEFLAKYQTTSCFFKIPDLFYLSAWNCCYLLADVKMLQQFRL